jgi:hypothetical protein
VADAGSNIILGPDESFLDFGRHKGLRLGTDSISVHHGDELVTASAVGPELRMDGCVEKLRRAQEHSNALQDELWGFFDSDPYRTLGQIEGDAGWYVFRVQVRRQPPVRIGVVLGDYIHQLRSSLDHFLWQLACWHLGKRPRSHLMFPIKTSMREIDRSIGHLVGKVPDDWLAVIKALQPHDAPDHPLALLEHFWNRDKHQTVIPRPVSEMSALGAIEFHANADAGPILDRRPRFGVRLEDGAEIARVKIKPAGPDPRVDMYGLTSVLVQVEGIPIIFDLSMASFIIRGIVGLFTSGQPAFDSDPTQSHHTVITSLESDDAARALGFHIPDASMRRFGVLGYAPPFSR